MAEKFNLGDKVRLKSGGPDMTVGFYDTVYDKYVCKWFDKTKLADGTFGEEDLELVPDAQGPAFSNPTRRP